MDPNAGAWDYRLVASHLGVVGDDWRFAEPDQTAVKIIIHYFHEISNTTKLAIASERLHRRTNEPVYRPDPIEIKVDRISCVGKHDYGDSLNQLWKKGESFINLEHDVAPWPGGLTQLWECEEIFCMFPILVHGAMNTTNFGCVKFSGELISQTKGIWTRYPRSDIFDWRSLDGWCFQKMREDFHIRPHVHYPPALHCNWSHL